MSPEIFVDRIKTETRELPGICTIKNMIERRDAYESLSLASGKANWSKHQDYNKYTSSMHTILCCGHVDTVKHHDNC